MQTMLSLQAVFKEGLFLCLNLIGLIPIIDCCIERKRSVLIWLKIKILTFFSLSNLCRANYRKYWKQFVLGPQSGASSCVPENNEGTLYYQPSISSTNGIHYAKRASITQSATMIKFKNFFFLARSIPTFLKYKLTKFHFYTMKGSSFFPHSKSINFRPPLIHDVLAAWLPKRTKNSLE